MKKKQNSSTDESYLRKFWNFLWYDDSLLSYAANFVVAFLFIKFILFPLLGFLLGTSVPVVAIVSGSMEHKISHTGNICDTRIDSFASRSLTFDQWWDACGNYYENNFDITKDEFYMFSFNSGLNTGDVMILRGKSGEDINLGDILVFVPGDQQWYEQNGPVIHRVVEINEEDGEYFFTTKGDRNPSVSNGDFETNISEEQVLAVGNMRIPYVGYLKVWLMNIMDVIL